MRNIAIVMIIDTEERESERDDESAREISRGRERLREREYPPARACHVSDVSDVCVCVFLCNVCVYVMCA